MKLTIGVPLIEYDLTNSAVGCTDRVGGGEGGCVILATATVLYKHIRSGLERCSLVEGRGFVGGYSCGQLEA